MPGLDPLAGWSEGRIPPHKRLPQGDVARVVQHDPDGRVLIEGEVG